VQQELDALAAAGIELFYLPSYSPELSGIEPIWHDVKHQSDDENAAMRSWENSSRPSTMLSLSKRVIS